MLYTENRVQFEDFYYGHPSCCDKIELNTDKNEKQQLNQLA